METHATKKEGVSYTDLFLRTVAVLGLIAVLLLGAWGIIQLAIAIPNLFGSIGSGTSSLFSNSNAQKDALTLSSAATISSGQTLQLSWTHKKANTSTQYSYAISYACESGLSLGAPVPTGSYQPTSCNTPFNYVNASAHMTVIPTVTGSNAVPLIITITATDLSTGAITASGTSTTMVSPSATTQTKAVAKPKAVTKRTTSTTYYPAATRAALYGYPDLATRMVSVSPNGTRTTVQFVIENDGTNIVQSSWTFNASLPINGSYTFASQPQQALYPGDKIMYSLSFDNTYGTNNYQYPYNNTYGYNTSGYQCNGYNCTPPTNYSGYNYNGIGYGIGTVTITADPQNYITEYNKGNNTASATTPIY